MLAIFAPVFSKSLNLYAKVLYMIAVHVPRLVIEIWRACNLTSHNWTYQICISDVKIANPILYFHVFNSSTMFQNV